MCGSCSEAYHAAGRRRWTSTHFLVLGLVVTLVGLSGAGIALRANGHGRTAAPRCSTAVADATAYQAVMTRDIRAGTTPLLADTDVFVRRVRAGAESDCAEVRRFVKGTNALLKIVCRPCAQQLALAVRRSA